MDDVNIYQIEFTTRALKNLKRIDTKYQILIIEKLEALKRNPITATNVKTLKGSIGFYRLRVANYRVIYELNTGKLTILVIDINHRKNIY